MAHYMHERVAYIPPYFLLYMHEAYLQANARILMPGSARVNPLMLF